MHTFKIQLKTFLILLTFICFSTNKSVAQTNNKIQHNELTIYAMPTLYPLDWSSPSALFKSMKTCYLKTITEKDNYLLGHVAVRLQSPLLSQNTLLIAQTSASAQEKVDLILKQKIGFGIMGAALKGRLETEEELKHKLNVYAKRKKLSFITYRINDAATKRIIEFIDQYSKKMNSKNAPCDFYGGAFWPLYKNEGASCSSFGVALLEIANISSPEMNDWKLTKKIPIELIGGEYNKNKKVKNYKIYQTNKWHNGKGEKNIDYVEYFVYEPSIMFNWIKEKRQHNNSKPYIAHEENGVPGLLIDCTTIDCKENTPIFKDRLNPNLFIDKYQEKIIEAYAKTNI